MDAIVLLKHLKSCMQRIKALLDTKIGTLSTLTTNSKTNVVSAINEVVGEIDDTSNALEQKANDTDVVKKADGLPYSLTLTMNGTSSTYKGTVGVSKGWYAPTSAGTSGYVLKSNGSGAPTWQQSVPVANGGTGATTAEQARTNLGAAPAYTYGASDLTAGTSALETGKLYFVYE